MKKRPPIIVVMGHVDHGKTTLLDNIRKSNVAGKEAGGITQSIGAYEIEHEGNKITFIDTPGHEAFSKMRSHGANVADLAILVVAADDGVQPQTKEAIKQIKEAKIPYVVAINKIDTSGSNPEKIKNDLATEEVYLEGRGGDVSFQEISALKGDGISDLLDLLLLAAEVEDLKYDPETSGRGIVIFSSKDKRKGVSVGVVVKDGKISTGDEIYAETTSGKVKTLENFLGEKNDVMYPSSPVLVLGFNDLPMVGELFQIGEPPKTSLPDPLKITEIEAPADVMSLPNGDNIPVILKAEETASLEVLKDIVNNLEIEPPLHIVGSSVGDIHENDANLAFSTGAIVIGFNVGTDKSAENIIRSQKTKIITSSIIYELQKSLEEYAETFVKKETGVIDILGVFGSSKGKQTIGGKVSKGVVKNQSKFEVFQNDKEAGSGSIVNLQSQKEDVQVAEEGSEVGLMVNSSVEIQKGDKLIFRD